MQSFLSMIYPDKDKELVISFGSPDRKVIVLDYSEKMQQKETIGKEFLSNLAGLVVMEKTDINEDGLDDIYLMNNGSRKLETTRLSPDRKKTNAQDGTCPQ